MNYPDGGLIDDYFGREECDECTYPASYVLGSKRLCSFHASQEWKKEK